MKRREFLKAMSALGLTTLAPSIFTDRAFINSAQASPAISSATVDLTGKRTPQVINIFLYGGASELAGNLTNINDLNTASQSKYAGGTALNPIFTTLYDEVAALNNPNADVGQVTPNAFWAHAGGIIMEDMLYEGDMAIYRTCNRRKNNTRAHRPSIFSGQKGTLDIDSAPGLGTTLAAVMANNSGEFATAFGVANLEEMVMPMVSFEGESTTFAPDPNATSQIPLVLKPVGLSANFDNPYRRNNEPTAVTTVDSLVDSKMKANPNSVQGDIDFDDLSTNYGKRYKKVAESFLNHRKLATIVQRFNDLVNDDTTLPLLPEQDPDGSNPDFDVVLYERFLNALGGADYASNGLYSLSFDWIDTDGVTQNDLFYLDLIGARIANPDGSPLVTTGDMANDPRLTGAPGNNRLVYPQNNNFADLLRAAVTLCIHNPDTKLAMVGSPGLGGWDDHNSAMTSYETRMQTLMSAVRAAVKHIKYSIDDPAVLTDRNGQDTSNIIINIFTDFGRNANLNNSQGWDHGNNQNFYTFGGRPYIRDPDWVAKNTSDIIRPVKNADLTSDAANYISTTVPSPRPEGALGKIVGTTNIFGTAGQNRLFTKPSEINDPVGAGTLNASDGIQAPSYEFEPQAIASTIYSWFGVTNPEVLTQNNDPDFATGDVSIMGTDGSGTLAPKTVTRSSGEPPIDERVAGITLSSNPLTVKNPAV